MKNIIFLLLTFCSFIGSVAQDVKKIESLDSFFAGVPLQKNYEKWVLHIATNFGIDSTNKDGVYSSFKSDKKNHFPFPDSVKVKILLSTAINKQTSKKIPVDTTRAVLIEGVWGNSKEDKREAHAYFNRLKSMLNVYYNKTTSFSENTLNFLESNNRKFPDISLEWGYLKELDFYYVTLMCWFDYWTKY